MSYILLILLAAIVFTLANLIFWHMIRVLIWVAQVVAFVMGIAVVVLLKYDYDTPLALLGGTAVYLALLSFVLVWVRLAVLEKEIIRLGGQPNVPALFTFVLRRIQPAPAKRKIGGSLTGMDNEFD